MLFYLQTLTIFMMKMWVCLCTNLHVFDVLTADVSQERIDTVLTKTGRTSVVNYSHMQQSSKSVKALIESDPYPNIGSRDNTHRNVTLTHEHSKTEFS